ncbi:MAG TPA: pyridoxamine 5'-phosphate oxidase [Acidimicrobiales bacterium]
MSEKWIPLEVADCDANPFVQFRRWFDEAKGEMLERDAVSVATSTLDGKPSSRMVLLRHVDDHSVGWFTNYESRKGRQLEANPFASLLWYCEPLGRQVRMEGGVAKMTAAESDAYFATRARGSQLGAHASAQSSAIASREELEDRVRAFDVEFARRDVPRPAFWGGYRLTPNRFEFWQHRDDRLHDRVVYLPASEGWSLERQAP